MQPQDTHELNITLAFSVDDGVPEDIIQELGNSSPFVRDPAHRVRSNGLSQIQI
jgi:hypothetical protein